MKFTSLEIWLDHCKKGRRPWSYSS
uniref:Uncharacterized protein n=1 Tax=Arundo donax TaxID=35708 RepID=A0A0A9ERU1_ARUDO